MSIPFKQVAVGDRVRLRTLDGVDEATITVTEARASSIENSTNFFAADEWEVAEIIAPPLPTKAGLYAPDETSSDKRYLMLAALGQWYWIDWSYNGSLMPVPLEQVEKYASTIKKVTLTR